MYLFGPGSLFFGSACETVLKLSSRLQKTSTPVRNLVSPRKLLTRRASINSKLDNAFSSVSTLGSKSSVIAISSSSSAIDISSSDSVIDSKSSVIAISSSRSAIDISSSDSVIDVGTSVFDVSMNSNSSGAPAVSVIDVCLRRGANRHSAVYGSDLGNSRTLFVSSLNAVAAAAEVDSIENYLQNALDAYVVNDTELEEEGERLWHMGMTFLGEAAAAVTQRPSSLFLQTLLQKGILDQELPSVRHACNEYLKKIVFVCHPPVTEDMKSVYLGAMAKARVSFASRADPSGPWDFVFEVIGSSFERPSSEAPLVVLEFVSDVLTIDFELVKSSSESSPLLLQKILWSSGGESVGSLNHRVKHLLRSHTDSVVKKQLRLSRVLGRLVSMVAQFLNKLDTSKKSNTLKNAMLTFMASEMKRKRQTF
jgi:hypothetical protein